MDEALQGLLVVDMSRYIAGPYATMLMADAGATVIKIEPPHGDATRSLEPFVPGDDTEVSAFYLRMNRGKKSVVLDVKTDAGRRALSALIAKADVLVENYRAGIIDQLGFHAARRSALNPQLVYCSISGFGHTPSPQRDRVAYNTVAEYEAGVYHRPDTADGTPGPLGPPVGDMVPALHALSGLLMALYRRSVTGEGAHVDIAMFDSMLSLGELRSSTAILTGSDRHPDGAEYFCPYGVFAVQDGHICLDVTTRRQWHGFCEAIGRPDLAEIEGMDTGPHRTQHYERLIEAPLQQWLFARSRDEAAAEFIARGVPVSVLRTPREALLSEQATARGMRIDVDGPHGTAVTVPASPIRISDAHVNGVPPPSPEQSAPDLGADTRSVLTDIAALDEPDVDALCTPIDAT